MHYSIVMKSIYRRYSRNSRLRIRGFLRRSARPKSQASPVANCWNWSRKARTFIASKGLKRGDRCGLLAANSIRWVAMDLALMAEGLIVVPLYSRQARRNWLR